MSRELDAREVMARLERLRALYVPEDEASARRRLEGGEPAGEAGKTSPSAWRCASRSCAPSAS